MKHLKLFFALFAMLALGVGNAWAEESFTIHDKFASTTMAYATTYTADISVSDLNGGNSTVGISVLGVYKQAKAGTTFQTNKKSGHIKNTSAIPGKITKIVVSHNSSYQKNTLKVYGAKGQEATTQSTLIGTLGTKQTDETISFETGEYNYFLIDPSTGTGSAQMTSITIYYTSSSGSEGGDDPDTPGTGGESSTATFTYTDLKGQGASGSGADFTGATKENIHMSGKGNGNNSYVQIYANNYLTFTPTNATITKIVLTATSGYIKTWKASEGTIEVSGDKAIWTGSSTSTVTLTNTASAQARITQMDVTYTASGSGEPEPVIVKTLKSIEVTGMTTTFEQGDVFKFDGKCTATYSVTKDGVAQADETVEVTPTSVSEPDMSTASTKEVTVTYTEGDITKTFLYNITVENALPKIVITQNEVAEFTNTYAKYTWTASGVSGKIYGYKNSGMQFNSSKDGSYVYNTDPIPGYIRKIKIVKASGTTRNWTPYVSETALTSAGGTTLDQKEVAATTTWEVTGENSYFYLLESGGATVIESITIYYEAVVPQVAAPTFTPAAGTYNAVQNVTISAEAGTTIRYTLDGTDPTIASNVYASAIEISETTTVKAIAVKGEDVSPIASATYTINLPLTTMDQIFAKATAVGSTATSVEITFGNWVVSAVKEDGKTAFVTDGTKGFVIFDKDVNLGFSVGNILSGTATCKVQLYNGFAELTELKSNTAGLSVGSGGTITTQELDATAIETLTGVNTGSLIKINGICSSSDSKYYVAGVQIYTALYNFGTLNVGAEYNITGIYQPYNSTKEMLPRSAEDIEEVVGLPTATIEVSNITMEVGQEKAIEATITPDAAQSTVQYAITAGSEFITLNGTTITAVAAGTATITATIAEVASVYNGATKTFTVTVKPQNIAVLPFTFNGGKADIENTLGMSQTGLDDDYNSAPKLKFNGASDNVIIHFDSQAGEFSFLLKQNGQNAGTFTVFESANGEDYTSVWAGGDFGNAQSETIKPTLSATARYVKFEYTTKGNSTNYALGSISIAKPDLRQEASLVWNPTSVTLTQGDAFTAPTLQNPKSVSGITYESSNDEVATVTTAGVIALGSATGTATITATFDGDATYKPATATCTITVNEYIETLDGEWQLVTDASKLQAGMEIIIASVEVDGKYYTMSKASDNGNNRTAVESTISGDKLNPAVGTSVLTLVDAGNGTFALQAGNGNYLYAASSSANQLKEKNKIDVNGQWTITIADNVATIKAEASSYRNWMQFNPNNGSPLFSCYAYDKPQKDIALYAKKPAESRTTSVGRYGTVCLPGNIVKCLGATLYEVAGKDGWRVVFDEVLTPEAGMPYIFLAHNAEVLFYCGDETAAAGNYNSLYGTFSVLQDAQLDGMYMVQNNKIVKCAATGCGIAENRAYFNGAELEDLESAPVQMPGRRRITMGTESENEATGTEDVVAPAGQTLKLIENGQLIIIRGGEKFNAQGQKL